MTILDIFGFDIKKQIIQAIPMYIRNNLVHEKVTVKNKNAKRSLKMLPFIKRNDIINIVIKILLKKYS